MMTSTSKKIKNKKGQLGLDTVKMVLISFLILSVIAVAIILLLSSLTTVADTIDTGSLTVSNETTSSAVTAGGVDLNQAFRRNIACTVTIATNSSSGAIIPVTNYSISGCTIFATGGLYNNTIWNVSYGSTFSEPGSANIQGNLSSGVESFFSNTSTIFAILVVVVIILAIAIIITAVRRFSSSSGGGL